MSISTKLDGGACDLTLFGAKIASNTGSLLASGAFAHSPQRAATLVMAAPARAAPDALAPSDPYGRAGLIEKIGLKM